MNTEYIEMGQASQITGYSITILNELVSNGTLDTITYEGKVLINKMDLETITPLRARAGYQAFSSLAAAPIHIAAAANKYGIAQQTISRWVQKGLIENLGKQGRKTLISEGDIAYWASLYKSAGGSQGKWTITRYAAMYQKVG